MRKRGKQFAAARAQIAVDKSYTLEEAMPLTATALAKQRISPQGQEGLGAFLNKRKPSWTK